MLWRTAVPKATVRLTDLGGLGVLVHGGFYCHATHCIDWVGTGGMALGDVYPGNMLCADGTTFRLGVAPMSQATLRCFRSWLATRGPGDLGLT